MTHAARLALAKEIAAKFHTKFGDGVYAIGIYGSLGRGLTIHKNIDELLA
jgi:hypothetical protein